MQVKFIVPGKTLPEYVKAASIYPKDNYSVKFY